MMGISVKFSAAHTIKGHPKCGRMHGHNYRVLVTLTANTLNKNGMIVDFSDVKKVVERVVDKFDHVYLNDVLKVDTVTAEYLAKYICDKLVLRLPSVHSVQVYENDDSWALYTPTTGEQHG
jgi:6-pyruvoyltetrahydropterin/6-carboxytetrahydropterin synthase